MKSTYLLALAAVTAIASTSFSQTSIPITNPSFENPPVASGGYTIYQFGAGTSNSVPGWTIASAGDVYDIQNATTPFANQNGSQYLEDFSYADANGGGYVYQILPTSFVPGTSYLLTAYATPDIHSPSSSQTGDYFFIANSSGTILAATTITATVSRDFVAFTVPFTSTGLLGDTGAIEIGFASPINFTQSDMEIDNFSLTATSVPEPGSIAMLALGGFGLFGLVRRKGCKMQDAGCRMQADRMKMS